MNRTSFLACLLFCFFFFTIPCARSADLPESFLASITNIQSIRTRFVSETRIPMFNDPVQTNGVLLFLRPNSLLWEYQYPFVEGFCLRDKEVVLWEGARCNISVQPGEQDQMSLILAKYLMSWIALDLEVIGEEYEITATNINPVSLRLTPKSKGLKEIIAGLSIVFQEGGVAEKVTIHETQGGTTTITFVDTVINGTINSSEFPQQ
jgi:Outer membrane lipoprotein-sorting protein